MLSTNLWFQTFPVIMQMLMNVFSQSSSYLSISLQSAEEEGAGPEEHTEQLVTPGSRGEMEEFERYSSSFARCHVSLHLPRVFVHLPSKSFLETLYSRLLRILT